MAERATTARKIPKGAAIGSVDAVPMLARSQHFASGEEVAVVSHYVTRPTGLHIHEFFEIVYVESGSLVHLYGPTRKQVDAGSLFIVNPSIPHGYDLVSDAPAQIWNIVLTEAALDVLSLKADAAPLIGQIAGHRRYALDYLHIAFSPETNAEVQALVKKMDREYQMKRRAYQVVLTGYLMALVGLISRAFAESGLPPQSGPSYHGKLGEVTRYIVENCHRPLSVERLAKLHGWTPDHLNRLIKRSFGDTTQGFIGRVRAAKAARLMLIDGATVDQAAKSVGYSDARALRRAFKRYYGVSPSEFRRTPV
mgnify:FL=1